MMTDYKRSVLLVIAAGIFLSTLGIGTRWMESANGMQIVFYRSIGLALAATVYVFYRSRREFFRAYTRAGRIGLITSLCLAGASIFIVLAVVNTSVANAMFIISLAPLVAGLFAWALLGEIVRRQTWFAMIFALLGVLIIVNGALSSDGLLGIVYAFLMLTCYGMFVVCLRVGKEFDMIPAVSMSAWLLIVVCFFLVDDFNIPARDILLCLGLGVFQVGLGTFLLVAGSAHVPAAQITLLAMLEVVLNPVWVWLGVGERPALATLIGGAIILLAICYEALTSKE